jgi:hypothetical protein
VNILDSTPGKGLAVKVNVDFIEPGFHTYIVNRDSTTRAIATFFDPADPGNVLYEIRVESAHGGMGDRVGADYEVCGRCIAIFMNDVRAGELK